jgi:hypothetical protein
MASRQSAERARAELEKQLVQLSELRNASTRDANFKLWRQTTLTLIQRTWEGDVSRPASFRKIAFSPPTSRPDTKVAREWFERGSAEAAALLRKLMEEVAEHGITVASLGERTGPEPLPEDGGTMLNLGGPAAKTPPPAKPVVENAADTAHPVIPTRIVKLPEAPARKPLVAGKPATQATNAKPAPPTAAKPAPPPAPPEAIEPEDTFEIEIEEANEPPKPQPVESEASGDEDAAPSRRGVSVTGDRGGKNAKPPRKGPRESLSRLLGFGKEESPDPPVQGSAYVPPEPRVPESGAGASQMHQAPNERFDEEVSEAAAPPAPKPQPTAAKAPAPTPQRPAPPAPVAKTAPAAKAAPPAPPARRAPSVPGPSVAQSANRPAPPPAEEQWAPLEEDVVAPLEPTVTAGPLAPPEFQQPPDGTPRPPSRMEVAAEALLRGLQAFQARDEKALQSALESALSSMSPEATEATPAPAAPASAPPAAKAAAAAAPAKPTPPASPKPASAKPVPPPAAKPIAAAPSTPFADALAAHEAAADVSDNEAPDADIESDEAPPPHDLLSDSPVFNVKAKPITKKAAVPENVFTSLTAIAVAAISTDLASHGVPENQRARVRAALLELATHLDQRDLTWETMREVVQFLMDFPPVARRVLPLLLPHLDQAA